MASSSSAAPAVVPAQLGFIAIYNPSLATNDDDMDNQIVYYASVAVQSRRPRRRGSRASPRDPVSQAERNERLRQIGLAQGMVEFGRSFSGDRPVDTVETDKSRVIMHELEPGWWILASIDLTRIPLPATKQSSTSAPTKGDTPAETMEYSSREVKPSALLLQDLLRAHSVFLMHHDTSLSSLFVRVQRSKFTGLLGRYWDFFLSTWNVMLHGNPIANVFGGIKVAASGELGVGVGEEDRGSGEREVLEGLVGRVEGLVDLVVSKFGTYDLENPSPSPTPQGPLAGLAQASDQWIGTGLEPAAEDGAIFLGTGAVSRDSLRNITQWMEDIYSWGEHAYGVRDSPTSIRRTRPRKKSVVHEEPPPEEFMLPPVPVTELAKRSKPSPAPASKASGSAQAQSGSAASGESSKPAADGEVDAGVNKYVDYLKLGYGKYWSIGGSTTAGTPDESDKATSTSKDSSLLSPGDTNTAASKSTSSVEEASAGHFLIGLMGAMNDPDGSNEDTTPGPDDDENSRTMLRTITVELEETGDEPRCESQTMRDLGSHDTELAQDPADRNQRQDGGMRTPAGEAARPASFNSQDRNKAQKMRVVVYVNRPFMFTFLFRLRTDSLAWNALYRSLHQQLAPLRRPLLASTAYRPARPDVGAAAASNAAAVIYDLVWDPRALTVHSTVPSIPDPAATAAAAVLTRELPPWSRAEALNTHAQLLNVFGATRGSGSGGGGIELERTCKTSRGWWIVWSRILEREQAENVVGSTTGSSSSGASEDDCSEHGSEETKRPPGPRVVSKEIFLLRKAGDHPGGGAVAAFRNVGGGGGGGWADGASRLAQGIGVDTRRYIEGLLSLNR